MNSKLFFSILGQAIYETVIFITTIIFFSFLGHILNTYTTLSEVEIVAIFFGIIIFKIQQLTNKIHEMRYKI